jgi:hypothetical protein
MVRVVLWQEYPSIHMSLIIANVDSNISNWLDVLMYTFQSESLCMVYLVILLASDTYTANGRCMKVIMEHWWNDYWKGVNPITGRETCPRATLSTITVLMSYCNLVQ